MTSIQGTAEGIPPGVGLLDRERIIARPGFNRWLVPPAALAIHLCIGMAYGFSVFWLPLSRAIGISKSVACPADMSLVADAVHHELRLEDQRSRLDVHAVLRAAGLGRRDLGRLAGARRARARRASSPRCAGAAAC